MRTITLLGDKYNSIDDFYADLSTQLQFGDTFMHNLIDLREFLAEKATHEPLTIIWKNYSHARMVFGVSVMGVNFFPEVLKILGEVKGVTLTLE